MENKESHYINKDNAVIRVRDVYKSFGDLHVLKGVDLDLYQGENLEVMGRSGTGKSVLIMIISRLLEVDKGDVQVLENDISLLTPKQMQELRLCIEFSFQHSA